jgi:hypothetical protein
MVAGKIRPFSAARSSRYEIRNNTQGGCPIPPIPFKAKELGY